MWKVRRTFFPSGWCFFYLVTTGWIFDIGFCENSINQSSGQSRVYRVTQLRADGVHFRESAGTGPVNLKVVPVTGASLAGHHAPLFPTPTIGMKWHVESTGDIWVGLEMTPSTKRPYCTTAVCVCCVFFPFILDIKFVGRTSRGHTGGRSHRISHPPSFCGACLNFSREKDSAIPFPRRP